METVVVVFDSRNRALEAMQSLEKAGVNPKHIEVLMPGETTEKEFAEKAHVDDESKTPGAWGAIGGGIGSFAGAAFMSAIIPGIGPVLGIGALAAAFIAGAVGGIKAGDAIEASAAKDDTRDDLWLFADMLRREKAVMVVQIDGKTDAQAVHAILRAAGGHTLDAARERWWGEHRVAEAAAYQELRGRPFDAQAELAWRRGYEAGTDPRFNGQAYDTVAGRLANLRANLDEADFRAGFERAAGSRPVMTRPRVMTPDWEKERTSHPSHA